MESVGSHAGIGRPSSSTVAGVYDAATQQYVELIGTRLTSAIEAQSDLDIIDDFAAGVAAVEPDVVEPAARVLDAGCGPGRVSARLAESGLRPIGIDLSSDMLRAARAAHRGLSFVCGDLGGLAFADWSFAGVVAWYSIIHTEPDSVASMVAEMARVLRPHGMLLVAFQAGDGTAVERDDAYGTGMALRTVHHDPTRIGDMMKRVGLGDVQVSVRPPVHVHETTAQAIVRASAPRAWP